MPESEYETVLRLGGHAASSLDLGLDWATFRRTESALDEFDAWLETHLAAKRAQPGDGLFSALIQAQDDGVGLSDRELKSVAGLVLAAGFETTVNLLGNAIRLIVGHPEQLAALRSGEASWLNAVEETLRFDPPVLLTARTATCDTRVADVDVAAGTLVVTVLAAANRDPKIFDDPDAFDVHRENAREHLAFSAGRHPSAHAHPAGIRDAARAVGGARLIRRCDEKHARPTAARSSQVPRTTQAPRRTARPPSSPP